MSSRIVYQALGATQTSTWIDDPFDIKGSFKGLEMSNHIRSLDDCTANLVQDFGKRESHGYMLTIDMLPEKELSNLLRLYIESIDREIENAPCGLDESPNSSFYCSMLAMLANNTDETRQAFAKTVNSNLVEYYRNNLEQVLEDACARQYAYEMESQGFYLHRADSEEGPYWSKY